jgi:Zn-dependent alcohol dehydrogenase
MAQTFTSGLGLTSAPKSAASYGAESWQMMKAAVVHKYGGPEELKFEEFPDPVPGAGEVLVRVAATSINPFDIMRRSGAAKDAGRSSFPVSLE